MINNIGGPVQFNGIIVVAFIRLNAPTISVNSTALSVEQERFVKCTE